MSLAQHVTATEGTDLEIPGQHATNNHKSVRRAISYDVLPVQAEHDEKQEYGGVTPYNVSVTKRIAQVATITLFCWLASGIVFGFAALKPIFVREGVYRDLCTPEEISENVEICLEQDLRLNFFFNLASTTCNISALPVGTLLDRYGPGLCYLVGSLCLATGSLLMSYAFSIPEFDGYTIANFFLALGGTFVFVPSFQIANAFPKFSGLIVALVTGAFDASAAVFLFYRIAYEATDGGFAPETFFLAYLAVPAVLVLAQLTFLPSQSYKSAPQLESKIQRAEDAARDIHESDDELADREAWAVRSERRERRMDRLQRLDELVGDADERAKKAEREEEKLEISGVWGVMHNRSAKEQMLSPWFVLITLLTVLQMVRMNYFIATIDTQYEYMLHSRALAKKVTGFFDVALPVGGVASTPFLGLLLDNISTTGVLGIIVSMTTLIGVFGSLPFLWAGYANVSLFVLLRPLYYSAMSDYAAKVFGFATFGRVYGTIIALSGLVNLSQTLLAAATKSEFHDNPIPVNVSLAAVGLLLGTVLVVFVAVQGRRLSKGRMVIKGLDGERRALWVQERDRLLVEENESEYGTF